MKRELLQWTSAALFRLLTKSVLHPGYSSNVDLQTYYRNEFAKNGYVKLTPFLSDDIFEIVSQELEEMDSQKIVRNFKMKEYETPRVLSVIGGSKILSNSQILLQLYSHYEIRHELSKIVGEHLYPVQHYEEFMVINILEARENTHGWHLDDPVVCAGNHSRASFL